MNQNDVVAAMAVLYPTLQVGIDYTTNNNNGVGSLALWNPVNGTPPTTDQLQTALDGIQLTGYKTLQSQAIENSFQTATYATPIAYMGTTFWTDSNSQTLLLGASSAMTMDGAVPSGFAWWDTTGSPIEMTLAQLQGLLQAVVAMINTNFVKKKALLVQIAAATTATAVQAIVW